MKSKMAAMFRSEMTNSASVGQEDEEDKGEVSWSTSVV